MTSKRPRRAGKRQGAERAGRRSEMFAAWYLRLRGFAILEMRLRTRSGEIDLIGKRGNLLIFVEVKRRASLDAAIFAVTDQNARRIEAAAGLYIARRRALASCDIRYDIIAIAGWRLRHLPGAWREGE